MRRRIQSSLVWRARCHSAWRWSSTEEVHELEDLLRELDGENEARSAASRSRAAAAPSERQNYGNRRRPTRRLPAGAEELDLGGLSSRSAESRGLKKKLRLPPTERTEAQQANSRRSRARRRGGHESRIHGELRHIFTSGTLNASGGFAWADRPIEVVSVEIREGRGDCVVVWAPPISASPFGMNFGQDVDDVGGLMSGGGVRNGGGLDNVWDARDIAAASATLARSSKHVAALLRRRLRMKSLPKLKFELLDDEALAAEEAALEEREAVEAVGSSPDPVEAMLDELEDELVDFELPVEEEEEEVGEREQPYTDSGIVSWTEKG